MREGGGVTEWTAVSREVSGRENEECQACVSFNDTKRVLTTLEDRAHY